MESDSVSDGAISPTDRLSRCLFSPTALKL